MIGAGASTIRAAAHSIRSDIRQRLQRSDLIAPAPRPREPLDDLRRIKHRFDASVNDVVLAAASGGVRRFLQTRGETPVPLKAMVPVSLRAGNGNGQLGNQISFLFVDLPCDEPDPARRLRDVKLAMSTRKQDREPEGAGAILKAFRVRTAHRAAGRLPHDLEPARVQPRRLQHPRAEEPLYMLGCGSRRCTRWSRSPTATRSRSASRLRSRVLVLRGLRRPAVAARRRPARQRHRRVHRGAARAELARPAGSIGHHRRSGAGSRRPLRRSSPGRFDEIIQPPRRVRGRLVAVCAT